MELSDFLELTNNRITGGSEYMWDCYGKNARFIDFENSDIMISMVYDTKTNKAYEMTVDIEETPDGDCAYRWVDEVYQRPLAREYKARGLDISSERYTDCSEDVIILTAKNAMKTADTLADTRVEVPLELSDDEIFRLMKMAHERDITLNQLVDEILRETIDRIESEESEKDWAGWPA